MATPELVITGLGAVGAFGDSPEALWETLLRGLPVWRPSATLPGQPLSCELEDFDLGRFRRTAKGHRVPRTSQYALAAASQAIAQAGLGEKGITKDEISIVYGTGTGPSNVIERNLSAIAGSGLGAVEPLSFQESVFNAPASLISIEYGFRGPLLALPMGWAAGGYALAVAADLLSFGSAQAVLVVASDESAPVGFTAYRALGLVSPNDGGQEAARPFDGGHNGAILGEGGAALVIETGEHAARRGASALMRLTGWAMGSDSFGVGPKGSGPSAMTAVLAEALARSGRDRVDALYSGSYCTADADRGEAQAVAAVFPEEGRPPVTNIRGTVGETKGVSGLLNVIAAAASLRTGVLPGTTGCEDIDPLCPVDVVKTPRPLGSLDSVLCNGFWVNGVNAALVLESCP